MKVGTAFVNIIRSQDGATIARIAFEGSCAMPLTEQHEKFMLDSAKANHPDLCSGNRLDVEWIQKGQP